MWSTNNSQIAFFELLRAGLWKQNVDLNKYGATDLAEIMQLAEEQSVVGLVTAGLEKVEDVKVPQDVILQFVGCTLQIEQRNKDMNLFVANLIERLRKEGVYALLIKGQGIAQCYERPLWRSSGDVDLLLSSDNYEKAASILPTIASHVEENRKDIKHFEMNIGSFCVELHGTLHGEWSRRVDNSIDEVQRDVFYGGSVRSWMNGNTQIFMPGADEDVFFVFTHILQHFFKGGIGLRQICDWCRLLWTYRSGINEMLLEKRLRKAGLMSEWRAFAAMVVDWLRMPADAMPLYSADKKWSRKAKQIVAFVVECGNFGHSRDEGYKQKVSFSKRLVISFGRRFKDAAKQFSIFPLDTIKAGWWVIRTGAKVAMRGK